MIALDINRKCSEINLCIGFLIWIRVARDIVISVWRSVPKTLATSQMLLAERIKRFSSMLPGKASGLPVFFVYEYGL